MIRLAQEPGVRIAVCGMSRELLGIRDEELVDGPEAGAKVTLFI
jgi:peroxiredoxin family protein